MDTLVGLTRKKIAGTKKMELPPLGLVSETTEILQRINYDT
jgi:hypothetical protein